MRRQGLGLKADPYGPFHGPLAHGYACGVHIAVMNGAPWNSETGCTCCTPEEKRGDLSRDWGIEGPDDWRGQAETLLDDRGSNPVAGTLLALRRQAAQYLNGRPVDPGTWRSAIGDWCRHNGIDTGTYQQLVGLAGMILDYEKRFVADGLLPPGGYVTAIQAWDFGRGANMARWGVQCGYTVLQTAQWYVVRAGEQARRHYASWADFSAGYVLGRCLHFDNGEFGPRYTEPLEVHHVMMSHPQSPWLNLPFHL
ncbi:DUF1266 domain-containing protein [Streptomonospora nanhaiensis]|uniref:DUF1266 domain-containing protein n=1 Tax=Streptomonospora nanhaiensis TaxID=1323731 RepID=A0A853BNK4_9ACTN|nr:DUF1266 domain-containing protein [Streptomonospora nanhaiensis]MBV2362073.1 DUF1266 domain-containing protein [Streptomonospora nanhaiensis]NYI96101.1 hypothetical protein [Streptomonospora nanhaiensis]